MNDIAMNPSDNSSIIVGNFTNYNGDTNYRSIMKFDCSASIVTSFNTSGSTSYGTVSHVFYDSNLDKYVTSATLDINRFNQNGTLDSTFNKGTFNGTPTTILLSSGKYLAVGGFTTYSGSTVNKMVRINTSGTIDTSIAFGGTWNGNPSFPVEQSDGKIVTIINQGSITSSSYSSTGIVRFNTDGTVDTSFNTGVGFSTGSINKYLNVLAIQSDGKLLVGGNSDNFNPPNSYSGSNWQNLIRINTDGTADTSFNNNVTSSFHISSSVTDIVIQPNGKILATNDNAILRFNTDGTKDTSFNTSGVGLSKYVDVIGLRTDGSMLAGHYSGGFPTATTASVDLLTSSGSRSFCNCP